MLNFLLFVDDSRVGENGFEGAGLGSSLSSNDLRMSEGRY